MLRALMIMVMLSSCIGQRTWVRPGGLAAIHAITLQLSATSTTNVQADEARWMLERAEDALVRSGFRIVTTGPVDAVGELSLSATFSYGWILSGARLALRDPDSGELLASVDVTSNGSVMIRPDNFAELLTNEIQKLKRDH